MENSTGEEHEAVCITSYLFTHLCGTQTARCLFRFAIRHIVWSKKLNGLTNTDKFRESFWNHLFTEYSSTNQSLIRIFLLLYDFLITWSWFNRGWFFNPTEWTNVSTDYLVHLLSHGARNDAVSWWQPCSNFTSKESQASYFLEKLVRKICCW